MQLAEDVDALAYDTAFWLVGYEEPGVYELKDLGDIGADLSRKLRALAIITLLTTGDSDKFCHNLIRSGRVREHYLTRMRQQPGQADHHLASARVDPLLDALAAGDVELAHRIAWISPRTWEPQREYEDDFCYAQILHRLIHGVQSPAVYQPFIDQFENALKGQPSERLAVVKALVQRSQADFDLAFEALLDARRKDILSAIKRAQMEDPIVLAGRQVFIEGLALLRLAERQGLQTAPDYLYCPSLARRPMRTPVPTEPDAP
ncbi:Imm49 family immunity protein [Variovorax rhizosphaerae]|uniref:Imm49 family immunity protein n=1 Tax=Variovorax rhizosphaerae TaxID=1836200 RepID=A0ABU8WRC3_9BURK